MISAGFMLIHIHLLSESSDDEMQGINYDLSDSFDVSTGSSIYESFSVDNQIFPEIIRKSMRS